MEDFKTKRCRFCGKIFMTEPKSRELFCSEECSEKAAYAKKITRCAKLGEDEEKTVKKKKRKETALHRIAREALEHGMTYGKYVAREGL